MEYLPSLEALPERLVSVQDIFESVTQAQVQKGCPFSSSILKHSPQGVRVFFLWIVVSIAGHSIWLLGHLFIYIQYILFSVINMYYSPFITTHAGLMVVIYKYYKCVFTGT